MTVKELKLYCTAMPDIKDTEALQEFMDKERAGTHKVACIKIGIATPKIGRASCRERV